MTIYQLFKVNLVGKGYTKVGIEPSPLESLSSVIIEESLPIVASKAPLPKMAYAVTKLSYNQVVVSIGSHWPKLSDEYGRQGLSFWHITLCVLPESDRNNFSVVANFLSGLLQEYEMGYEKLGNVVEGLAKEKPPQNWTRSFERLAQGVLDNEDHWNKPLLSNIEQVPEHANLIIPFPFHKHVAIYCLLELMFQKSGITRIAGGALSGANPKQFQHISTLTKPSSYQSFRVVVEAPVEYKPLQSKEKERFKLGLDQAIKFCQSILQRRYYNSRLLLSSLTLLLGFVLLLMTLSSSRNVNLVTPTSGASNNIEVESVSLRGTLTFKEQPTSPSIVFIPIFVHKLVFSSICPFGIIPMILIAC